MPSPICREGRNLQEEADIPGEEGLKSQAGVAPVFVISGPSGVGKTTLVDALLARTRLPLRRAITATTRTPRTGEVPGLSYHFWTVQQFQQAIAHGEMLEWARVHETDFYGTPRSEVEPYRLQGIGVILVIDVQGAAQVRAAYAQDCVTLFILPPRFEDLLRRLAGRGENPEAIQRRLRTAEKEMARQNEFDHVIVNEDLATATEQLEAIIRQHLTQRRLVYAG